MKPERDVGAALIESPVHVGAARNSCRLGGKARADFERVGEDDIDVSRRQRLAGVGEERTAAGLKPPDLARPASLHRERLLHEPSRSSDRHAEP